MATIITPQFWVAYDTAAPTNSGMYTKSQCVLLNDSWMNILTAGGHKEYRCVDSTDQAKLKWDNLDGTPFNY